MNFTKMFLAKRRTEVSGPRIEDIQGTIASEMGRLNLQRKIKSGMRIAVTAGSRGVANNVLILATVVSELKK